MVRRSPETGRAAASTSTGLGHGTAVAAAIRERAPGAELLAVKVFDRRLSASIEALVAGIGWAAAHDADLINLSLGTANRDHTTVLRSAVLRAAAAGALVVAAGTHEGVTFLPGSLEGVLRVELEWSCPRLSVEVVSGTGGGDAVCRASGYPRPVTGVSWEHNLKGISFAVANVTGVLARVLTGGSRPSVATAIAALRRGGGAAPHVPLSEA